MQDGYPIAVCSQLVLKLLDFTRPFEIESRWPTHEKEMLVVVYALRKWRHYVQDKFTKVVTDNISLQYFQSQPRLSAKQIRWQDMLVEFDIEIVHKKGKLHTLLDALSRMPQIHHMSVITMQGWIEEIRQAQENDAVVRQLRDEVESGQTAHGLYKLRDGLLWSEDKVVIPNNIQKKTKILREVHDCHMARHGGQKRTLNVAKKYIVYKNEL